MTATTIAAVRAGIYDLLEPLAALATASVRYRPPLDTEDVAGPSGAMEAVWLSPEVDISIEPAALGGGFSETYAVSVVVQCLPVDTDTDLRDADARCAELATAVMDKIESTPRLGLSVSGWGITANVSGLQYTGGPFENGGFAARMTIDIAVEATRCP